MIWVRRGVASFLGLLFVLLLLPTLVLASFNQTLLNPSFLKETLREADVYTFAVRDALPALLRQQWEELRPQDVELPLTPQEAIQVLQQAFPAPWLQAQVEEALDAVVPYVIARQESFSSTIALQEPKDRLWDGLMALLDWKYQALPECSLSQLNILGAFPDPKTFLICRPPGVSFMEAVTRVGFLGEVRSLFDTIIPTSITVTEQDVLLHVPELASVRERLAPLPKGLLALEGLLTLLFLGVALLGGRGLWGKMVWGSAALCLGSLAALLLLWWAPAQVRPMLLAIPAPGDVPALIHGKGQEVALLLLRGSLTPARTWALILLVAGAMFLGLSILLPRLLPATRSDGSLRS